MFKKSSIRSNDVISMELKQPRPKFDEFKTEGVLSLSDKPKFYDVANASAEGLGAAIAVLRKAKDWAAVRVQSTLLKKIEAVAPDILFDVEKKLVFTSNVVDYSVSFLAWADDAFLELAQAVKSEDEARIEEAARTLLKGLLTYINQVGVYFHDFQSFFGSDIYDSQREKLNSMSVDDRRKIEAFYSRFAVAIASMARIYTREIPTRSSRGTITAEQIIAWVRELVNCIDRLYESALLMLES